MKHSQLVQFFFDGSPIECKDQLISSGIAEDSDVLLPLVLYYIKSAIKNTIFEDEILNLTLVKQSNSLCFFVAQDVEILNVDLAKKVIQVLGGYKALQWIRFDEHGIIDITLVVEYFREQLKLTADGEKLTSQEYFQQIFSTLLKSDVDKKPLCKQLEQYLKLKDHIEVKNSEEPSQQVIPIVSTEIKPEKTLQTFNIEKHFHLLSSTMASFFEELTFVACAEYIFCSPSTEVQDINARKLPEINGSLLLSGLIGSTALLNIIAEQFNCQPSQVIMFDKVYQSRKNLKSKVVTRTFQVGNDSSKNWYKIAKEFVTKLTLKSEIQDCCNVAFDGQKFNCLIFIQELLKVNDEAITALNQANKSVNRVAKAIKIEQKLKLELNAQVVGQTEAINSLTQGYLTSSISSSEGPRLIYTFAGPSGVGKTYLSSIFCDALNKLEKSGYVASTFNMEQYSDERDSSKLFGSGFQYNDSGLGVLTNAVKTQPRHILLFDEIEKAHPTVIQSLLGVLDKGKVEDKTSLELIDFTQCIVVFTTNLGQETLAKNNQKHSLNVFDVLRNAENPTSKTKLTPEFVNRLAKGYSLLFSSLKVNHFTYLAEQALNKVDGNLSDLQFIWPKGFASFLLQTISPEITARQLINCLPKLKSEILSKTSDLIDENSASIIFDVCLEESASTLTAKHFLLFDNDDRLQAKIEQIDPSITIHVVDSPNKILLMLQSHRPEAFLIDTESVSNSAFSLNDVINQVHNINANLPVFSYRVASVKSSEIKTTTPNHHVREHFEVGLTGLYSSFSNMLERINYYLATEKTLSRMLSRNEKLHYHCQVEKSDVTGHFNVVFNDLTVEQVIQSQDIQETSFFNRSLPAEKLNDVIGLDRAKRRLTEVIGWLKSPEKLASFGVKVPTGFLFAGPPGTGKTLLAKAVAGECQLPFFSVSASELSSSYIGRTAENVIELFSTARKYAPAIIFIDEIDAIASERSGSDSSGARDNNLTVNALLTEMDGFSSGDAPIFVMAATNLPQLLDKAITRPGRFDETIYCDLPNSKARSAFFERFALKHNLHWQESELQQLISSSQGMSAADIDQVLREAIYQAVGKEQPLTVEHIKQTMVRIVYGAPSEHIILSNEEKRRTAYHEAAHLLAYKLLFPKQAIDFVTIEPRNQALGFVATRAAEEYESYSKIRVKAQLQVLLAGRVAEKLCTGDVNEVSTGAANDIEKATQLAMHAIYEGGIETSVGPVNVGMLTKFEESDLLANAQQAVKKWLEQAEQDIENLLTEHYQQLTLVAETLLEKESLLGDEIAALFS